MAKTKAAANERELDALSMELLPAVLSRSLRHMRRLSIEDDQIDCDALLLVIQNATALYTARCPIAGCPSFTGGSNVTVADKSVRST